MIPAGRKADGGQNKSLNSPFTQVLEGVRPFLMVAGGSIQVKEISGVGGLQTRVLLHMEGNNQSLFSVRMEITQRILRNFMVPGLRVDWTDQDGGSS